MLIPTGVHELDEFHTALGESAGHQAVVGEGALAFYIGAVHVENGLGFAGKIGELGHAGLHAESHFILADARGDFGITEVFEFGFVELGDVVEEATPDFAAHTVWIGKVQNGVTIAAELDTLIFAGEKSAPPKEIVEDLATTGFFIAAGHDDEGGKVLGVGA